MTGHRQAAQPGDRAPPDKGNGVPPAGAAAGGGGGQIGPVDGSGKSTPRDMPDRDPDPARGGPIEGDTHDGPPDRVPHTASEEDSLAGAVALLAGGENPLKSATRSTVPGGEGESFIAHDFTYDQTHLPRYPNDITAVASSIKYANLHDHTRAYGTGAGIVTGSSFDDVAAWYQSNVPPGWKNTSLDNIEQQAMSALSNDFTQLLLGHSPAAPRAKAVARPRPQLRMSLFTPAGAATPTQDSSIMVVQEPGKEVTVYLQAQVK